MAFNTQEQEIIKYGLQNGKSKEQVTQALTNFRLGITTKPIETTKNNQSFLKRVGEDITTAKSNIKDIISGAGEHTGEGAIRRGTEATAEVFNLIPKVGYEALPQPVRKGLDIVGQTVGKGANFVIDKLSDLPAYQEYAKNFPEASKSPQMIKIFEDLLGTASATGQIAGDILLADQVAKAGQAAITKTGELGKAGIEKIKEGTEFIKEKIPSVLPKSEEIMNRVARLKPTDAQKFQKLAGKTHGEYLKETGNFGTPDEIIKNEAVKFTKSLNTVDTELAKLPGVYKEGSITDAIDSLVKKAEAISSKNVKAPYLKQALDLQAKNSSVGLSMEDINAVKRLFEREVKLGYGKLGSSINPEGVQQATNIDSALRKWQVGKAQELGFENIAELNKQTQLSKFIIDKLGNQIVGQGGLNGVSLTDWIMLSGGNPTAVAGFLTKKFFGSKGVQAKIAEYLNKSPIKGQIEAKITPSKLTTPQLKEIPKSTYKEIIPQEITKSYLTPEVKTNIVKIIDDYMLNKGKDLTLQSDAAVIAETLGIKMPKNYGTLVKKLQQILEKNDTYKVIK